jgi:hypothetical protein
MWNGKPQYSDLLPKFKAVGWFQDMDTTEFDEAAASDADDDEDLVEQIIEEGEVVFARDWDSGGLGGGAGRELVDH